MKLPGKGMSWKQFFVELKNEYKSDRINDAAGALTYFGLLAIFPFLLFLVSLASVIIQPQQAEALIDQLSGVAPNQAMTIIEDRLRALGEGQSVGLLSVGILGALWAASGGVAALIRALNVTYDVEESRPFWKVRGIAILFVLGGGVLGILATLAILAVPAIANALGGGAMATVINWLRIPVAAAIVMLVWAVAYYALPDVKQKFKFITPGSVIGVIVWMAASLGFSFYVSNFGNYDATYGSLGGIIVLLLWMWISSQVLLLGAEINAIIEHRSEEGKEPGEKVEGQGAQQLGPQTKRERLAQSDERHAGRRGEPRESLRGAGFSPSYKGMTHRRLRESGGVSAARRPREDQSQGKVKKVAFAVWGAVMGAALISLRRRPA